MTDLSRLREEIDAVDNEIVRLLEQRMVLSKKVGEYKDANGIPILDRKREDEVVQSRVRMLSDPSFSEAVKEIFRLVMRYSRRHQERAGKVE